MRTRKRAKETRRPRAQQARQISSRSVIAGGSRVAIEAGVRFGWERYVGDGGSVIGLDRFGASAPHKVILEELGLTADAVAKTALSLLAARKSESNGQREG